MVFTINPCLLIFPKTIDGRRQFCADIDAGRSPIVMKSPEVVSALLSLPPTFTKDEFITSMRDKNIADTLHEDLFSFFIENSIFLSEEDVTNQYPTAQQWKSYQWDEAYKYHRSTTDFPFIVMESAEAFEEDERRMKRYKKESEPPSIYQELPSVNSVQLNKIKFSDNTNEQVSKLSDSQKMGIEGINLLFDLCFGERRQHDFGIQGNFVRKSVPSGGARHPAEIFLVAFDGSPLKEGVYHYNVKKNALDAIKEGDFYKEAQEATFDLFSRFEKKPMGLIVFTSLHERAMWRYREDRSWRAIPIDVGHAVMAFRQTVESLGFKFYTYQKFEDSKISSLIGVDRIKQSPLFLGSIVAP